MASGSYNLRNPAVKRILQEVKELEKEGSTEYMAKVLEDNLFEWHFIVRGPSGTDFEGGIYHGRILLPPEYPMKPPSFMMLTPNGRFQTSTKICLSISSHHPEHWQPSWSVRTALVALTAFMPSPGNGAIGSLDFSPEERRKLALESREFVPEFGSAERRALSSEMHSAMLAIDASEAAKRKVAAKSEPKVASAVEQVDVHTAEAASFTVDGIADKGGQAQTEGGASIPATQESAPPVSVSPAASQPTTAPLAHPSASQPSTSPARHQLTPSPRNRALRPVSAVPRATPYVPAALTARYESSDMSVEDKGLTWLAGALSVAIAALLLRKLMGMFDVSIEEILPL